MRLLTAGWSSAFGGERIGVGICLTKPIDYLLGVTGQTEGSCKGSLWRGGQHRIILFITERIHNLCPASTKEDKKKPKKLLQEDESEDDF